MTDPIQEARALLARSASEYAIPDVMGAMALELLPVLITEAERWRAMAIEEKASKMDTIDDGACEYRTRHEWCNKEQKICDGWPYMFLECPIQDAWRARATAELAAESSSWRKIGPGEEKAIAWAIELMGDCEAASVLRKLLGGMT